MFKLEQNSENIVALILGESETLTNPYYLFELTNCLTQKQVLFNASDTSTATTRYNKFNII